MTNNHAVSAKLFGFFLVLLPFSNVKVSMNSQKHRQHGGGRGMAGEVALLLACVQIEMVLYPRQGGNQSGMS